MAKPDACAHLDLEGRCPAAPGEVAVLAGDAEEDGHELGDRIDNWTSVGGVARVAYKTRA